MPTLVPTDPRSIQTQRRAHRCPKNRGADHCRGFGYPGLELKKPARPETKKPTLPQRPKHVFSEPDPISHDWAKQSPACFHRFTMFPMFPWKPAPSQERGCFHVSIGFQCFQCFQCFHQGDTLGKLLAWSYPGEMYHRV